MLQTCRIAGALTKLGPWLCCSGLDGLIDHYLCLYCRNHLAVKTIAIYKDNIISSLWIRKNNLQSAVQKLSAEQRRVIVLKLIKGFSNHEVADILHVSNGAVKFRQHRALTILFHLLTTGSE